MGFFWLVTVKNYAGQPRREKSYTYRKDLTKKLMLCLFRPQAMYQRAKVVWEAII